MDWMQRDADHWIAETDRGTFTIERRSRDYEPFFVIHLSGSPIERNSETGSLSTLDDAQRIARRHYDRLGETER